MDRGMCGIREVDKIANHEIRRTKERGVAEIIKNLEWKYATTQ